MKHFKEGVLKYFKIENFQSEMFHRASILTACRQSPGHMFSSLFALRTLRQHGLPRLRLPSTNSVMHLQPGGGSPPQTIVVAWKYFCADRLNWAIVLIAQQLLPVFALMPTINCLLGSPGTASTCYIRSFLLSVNSITVFAAEVITTNFLTEPLVLMTITS